MWNGAWRGSVGFGSMVAGEREWRRSVLVDGRHAVSDIEKIRRLHHAFPPQTIATAFYRDVLRKRDGVWTFEERVTDGSLRGDVSRHLRRRRDRPIL